MPYRFAHYYLLLLFPLSGLAFWRNYFSDLPANPIASHVHAITASLWIALLMVQSWSIHARQNRLHRAAGYASFVILPLFTAGGFLILQAMATKFAASSDPFNAMYGARLGALDLVSSLSIPFFFYMALRWRRNVHLHARYMLVTALFLLAPILSRLMPILPPLSIKGPEDFPVFAICLHLSNLLAVSLALVLFLQAPRHGYPFLTVTGFIVTQSVVFETVGRSLAWETLFASLAEVPVMALAALGLGLGAGAAWLGWNNMPLARRSASVA